VAKEHKIPVKIRSELDNCSFLILRMNLTLIKRITVSIKIVVIKPIKNF
jgi:hypothetical protein